MGHNEYGYGLKSLADDQLLSGLASIVHRRNQITAEFLAYLAELDERQLFLDLGFPSLFEYCVVKLGLCESTAGRHIAAARVCRKHPRAFELVASGSLHASALSLLKKHVTSENAAELFELCTHQSARKVEELLAARFPRPDVRDLVRRLPPRASGTLNVGCSAEQAELAESSRTRSTELEKTPAASLLRAPSAESDEEHVEPLPRVRSTELENLGIESLSRLPSTESEKAPVASQSHAPSIARGTAESPKPRRLEPLSADRYGVHFTADGEFCELLERVRGLAGHRLPSGDLMTLLKRGLEAYERELEKERFAAGRKARPARDLAAVSGTLSAPEAPSRAPSNERFTPDPTESEPESNPMLNPKWRRRVPAEVVRAVVLRDGKRCSFVSRDGRQCGARRCLELDHIEPLALGGESTIENLRLRCRAHNQWYARQYFGASRVNAAIQWSKRRRAAMKDEKSPGAKLSNDVHEREAEAR